MRGSLPLFRIGLVAAAFVVATSASAEDGRKPVRSMLELRQARAVTQIWDISCGAAALATILKYQFGQNVTERDIALSLMTRKEYLDNPNIVRLREGFSLLDMKRVAEKRGFRADGLGKMNFEDLVARAPIIVPLSRDGYHHFVVFRGIRRDRVLIADPSFGTRTLTLDKFMKMWLPLGDKGRVGFVVRPRDVPMPGGGELAPHDEEFLTFG